MHTLRLALALLAAALSYGCDARVGGKLTPAIDWQSLEFKCTREQDSWPKADADPQGEAWYLEGARLRLLGYEKDDQKLLKEGFDLTFKAAERNHALAMNNLVVAYLNGDGVKPSDALAVEWAEKLIKLNIGMGYYHMGTFLQQGIGVHEDRKAALTYFRKAADLGNPQGQLASGNAIRGAVARSAPDEKARGFGIGTSMLKCALAQGLGEAGYSLGRHYSYQESKIPEALQAFQAAAKLGHNSSLFELWVTFRDGESGVEKDAARAACYERLWTDSTANKTKKFPSLDALCPLPPAQMPP